MTWEEFSDETKGLEFYEQGPPERTLRVWIDRDSDSIQIRGNEGYCDVEASVALDSDAPEKEELERGCRLAERLMRVMTVDPLGTNISIEAKRQIEDVRAGFLQPGDDLVAHGYLGLYDIMEVEIRRRVSEKMTKDLDASPIDLKTGYPHDWPRCPGCGKPALDGHITCGDAGCDEGGRR